MPLDPAVIRKQVQSMVTDVKRTYMTQPGHPRTCNVCAFYKFFFDDWQHYWDLCRKAQIGCGEKKKLLAEKMKLLEVDDQPFWWMVNVRGQRRLLRDAGYEIVQAGGPYPVDTGRPITGASTSPATTPGSTPSIPAATTRTSARHSTIWTSGSINRGETEADVPSALANTLEIARRCNLTLELGKPQLPNYPTPEVDGVQLPMDAYFRHASLEGLEARLARLYPDEALRQRKRPAYVERLEFEIDTILKMGFPGYFLIVGDFINWAKNNGCPVGPGRGSGAGSLVAVGDGGSEGEGNGVGLGIGVGRPRRTGATITQRR